VKVQAYRLNPAVIAGLIFGASTALSGWYTSLLLIAVAYAIVQAAVDYGTAFRMVRRHIAPVPDGELGVGPNFSRADAVRLLVGFGWWKFAWLAVYYLVWTVVFALPVLGIRWLF
jgi:hypothetical protein